MLTIKQIDSLKPKEQQYKVADMAGLYLVVTPRNIKSWRYNYKDSQDKYKTKTYGLYPEISLAKARLLNSEFKDEQARLKLHGLTESRVMTFKQFVEEKWYKHHLPDLKSAKHKAIIQASMDQYVFDKIGDKPLDKITRKELVELVQGIQGKGVVETANRIASRLGQVFTHAVNTDEIQLHPATNLCSVLRTPVRTHMPCIDVSAAKDLFQAIKSYDEPVTRLGLMLLALTFVRTTELRYFERKEIKDGNFWVIPGERMKTVTGKTPRPHVVPLTKFTLSIIKELEQYTGDDKYVLGSLKRPNHPISENTLLFALYRLGYRGKMTGHGFRALASTVLNNETIDGRRRFDKDWIERQLAHNEIDDVRASYNRAEYLEHRISMMQFYSDWIEAQLS
ncbi:tyrosine-type recombinase/integrase [Methylotenera sp.]|uniref:tyrosine-type recombinase/integrase n=1 Tax=Methylotenera sp. TaxID=2051956 RepID=UPI002ED7F550